MSTNWSIDLGDPETLETETITAAVAVLTAELRRRSLENSDPAALTEHGFEKGFDDKGAAREPWVSGGILVVPGSKIDRSAMSHSCRFVRIGKDWVWESEHRFQDTVRYVPGPRSHMQSVTLVTVNDGDTVDMIESRTRSGVHELVSAHSYVVNGDRLELTSTRSVSAGSHR